MIEDNSFTETDAGDPLPREDVEVAPDPHPFVSTKWAATVCAVCGAWEGDSEHATEYYGLKAEDAPTPGASAAEDAAFDKALDYARGIGVENGRAAASWYFDGNTSDATYSVVLKGIEDGDPEVLDTLPYADLSGEWADTLTGPQLVTDALDAAGMRDSDDGDEDADEYDDWFSDICDAYNAAFAEASQDEIECVARLHVDAIAGRNAADAVADHDANVDGQHDEMETRDDCPACGRKGGI